MANMNGANRAKFYPLLLQRDGPYCRGCGKMALDTNEGFLLIDHIDNNNANNILENMQLLCRVCNFHKNPPKSTLEDRPQTPEMKKNQRCEPLFRRYILGRILSEQKLEYEEALDAGSEFCQISTETAKRYLKKMLSSEGLYKLEYGNGGSVYIKAKE